MAHRPTNPSPYFECVDATKDIDVRFLIANHDVVTSAKIKVMKNDLDTSTDTFPVVAEIELSDGTLRAYGASEKHTSSGSESLMLGYDFYEVTSILVDGKSTSYAYAASTKTVTFNSAPESGKPIVVNGNINIPGDWRTSISGGNGNESFVKMQIPANLLANGTEYKWSISMLNGEAVDNREFYFKTSALPTVSIIYPAGDKIESVSADFVGSCDGDIEYYRWEIRNSDGDIIESTDHIYDVNLKHSYTGLFSGIDISVTLYVKTKMRSDEISASKSYAVDYDIYNSNVMIDVNPDPMRNRIAVDFTGMSYIPGKSSENRYELSNGCVHIDAGDSIVWNSKDENDLEIPSDTGYSLKFKLDDGFCGLIVEINDESGSFKFGYDGSFYYTKDNVETKIDMSAWFVDALMFQSSATDGDYTYKFSESQTVNFDDSNTFVKVRDGACLYWWYLIYDGTNVSIVKGESVNEA